MKSVRTTTKESLDHAKIETMSLLAYNSIKYYERNAKFYKKLTYLDKINYQHKFI